MEDGELANMTREERHQRLVDLITRNLDEVAREGELANPKTQEVINHLLQMPGVKGVSQIPVIALNVLMEPDATYQQALDVNAYAFGLRIRSDAVWQIKLHGMPEG